MPAAEQQLVCGLEGELIDNSSVRIERAGHSRYWTGWQLQHARLRRRRRVGSVD